MMDSSAWSRWRKVMPMRLQPPWTGERLVGDEGGLLFGGEFEDAAALFLGGEGGEDLVVEAEVGVVHVGAFDGSGELEGEAAEEGYVRVGLHPSDSLLSLAGRGTPIARR
jgi:hypothetical protein